jgi:uncharacterized membrane protein
MSIAYLQQQKLFSTFAVTGAAVLAQKQLNLSTRCSLTLLSIYILGKWGNEYLQKSTRSETFVPSSVTSFLIDQYLGGPIKSGLNVLPLVLAFGYMIYGKNWRDLGACLEAVNTGAAVLTSYELLKQGLQLPGIISTYFQSNTKKQY